MLTQFPAGTVKNWLTVITEVAPRIRTNGQPRRLLLVKCKCGKEKIVMVQSFSTGRVKSCGCYQREVMKKGDSNRKHGCSSHPLFSVWRCMINRCYDPSHKGYKYYGERGITVCKEWRQNPKSFIDWAINNGWKKGLQIDKDIKKGKCYSPGNCLIVTPEVNRMNRSCSKFNKLNTR